MQENSHGNSVFHCSYLVQLEPERNPGWEAIEFNHKWLLKSMDDLQNLHLTRANTRASQANGAQSDSDPPQVEFVLSLCRFFCNNAPDFFKYEALFSSVFIHRDKGISVVTWRLV